MQALVIAALEHAGVQRADVHFLAVHGTGTPLGDPIEVGALGAALGTGQTAVSQLVLGSSKVIRKEPWRACCRGVIRTVRNADCYCSVWPTHVRRVSTRQL